MLLQFFAALVGIFVSAPAADAYKAATAVHSAHVPCNDGTWACGKATLKANAELYAQHAQTAAEKGADIIVFPEDGLTGLGGGDKYVWYRMGYTESIPEVNARGIVPCNEGHRYSFRNAPTVIQLSCIARDKRIALVANLLDWDYYNSKLYNTDVVFDTDGTFLAKYHKLNLWGEQGYIDVPTDCPEVTFTTSFNVTFGVITCADLIYKFPVLDLVAKGVKNFVMPAAWDNSMAQMQVMAYVQGWSLAHKTNIVLSNLQWNGRSTSSGSGIWSAGMPLAHHYARSNEDSSPLVAEIPEPGAGRRLQAMNTSESWEQFSLLSFESDSSWKFATLSSGKLCTRSVCCQASVTSGSSTGYVLAALDGRDSGGDSSWSAQICAVLPCSAPGSSCLQYHEPDMESDLKGLSLKMSGLTAESVVPEVIAMERQGDSQKTLPPVVGLESMHFESSGSEAQLSLSTSTYLSSALIYSRAFNEPLPYQCPHGKLKALFVV